MLNPQESQATSHTTTTNANQSDNTVPSTPSHEMELHLIIKHDEIGMAGKQLDGASSPKPLANVEMPIKMEPGATSRAQTTVLSTDPASDNATIKAIAAAQNEYGTRVRETTKAPVTDLPTSELDESNLATSPVPALQSAPGSLEVAPKAPSKKRPAPNNSTSKASAGIKKPLPKKRKLESVDERGTPASTGRSATPASTSGHTTKAAGKGRRKSSISATPAGTSPAPASSPAAASQNGSEDEEDSNVYCICRRPDNHTWMIGCDGGCEDWFHGKCVNIQKEDDGLIDKYICPLCTEKGVGVTTWKPMCRRDGCRKPARLKKGAASKYCSGECAMQFIKTNLPAELVNTHASESEESDLGPLGGAIRTHELKALALAAPTVEAFRDLGAPQLPTPPLTASPDSQHSKKHSPRATDANFAPTRLAEIAAQKVELRQRRALYKDREAFVVMAKERAAQLAVTLKTKDACGYDARLSWDDVTFSKWRDSAEGVATFTAGALKAPKMEELEGAEGVMFKSRPAAVQRDAADAVGWVAGVCLCAKKRCQRHFGWQKLWLQEVRFEESEVAREMREADWQERDVRDGGLGRGFGCGVEEEGSVEVLGGGAVEVAVR